MAGNGVSGRGQPSGIQVAQQWPALPVNAHPKMSLAAPRKIHQYQ